MNLRPQDPLSEGPRSPGQDARDCALAALAAALLRIAASAVDLARGSGRPEHLEDQAELLLVSLDAYFQAAGAPPDAAALREALLALLEKGRGGASGRAGVAAALEAASLALAGA